MGDTKVYCNFHFLVWISFIFCAVLSAIRNSYIFNITFFQ